MIYTAEAAGKCIVFLPLLLTYPQQYCPQTSQNPDFHGYKTQEFHYNEIQDFHI